MKKGDLAFFYHSNCKPLKIVGIMEIVQEHSIDGKIFSYFFFLSHLNHYTLILSSPPALLLLYFSVTAKAPLPAFLRNYYCYSFFF